MKRQNTKLRSCGRVVAILLVIGVSVACLASSAWACPTCAEGVADGSAHGRGFATGLYYSILFMMSMPFIILGALGTVFYHSVKRAKAEQEALAAMAAVAAPEVQA